MMSEFEMLMFGEIKFFVSLQINKLKHETFITQSKYVKEILNFFGMEDSKPISTPMVTGHKLSKNDESREVNQTLYKSVIGKLQYVVHSKPDIALPVGIVVKFSANPKDNHIMAVKRIMRYLKGTANYGLYYKKNVNFELKTYTYADWDGSLDEKKSTSGGDFFLGSRLVSWTSKKQNCIS